MTIVEFSDYQCPFCVRYFRETLTVLDREYVATGKVKYVLRNFPIESTHPLTFKAAEAAMCAGDQERSWEMHDRLFTQQDRLGLNDLPTHAQALALADHPGRPALRRVQDGHRRPPRRKDERVGGRSGSSLNGSRRLVKRARSTD